MSFKKIALFGATGNIGGPILKALLDAGFEVTVLSREGSTSTDSLPSHPNQKVVKVNYDDAASLTAALTGNEAVVSNVASSALLSQKTIIDAAIAAGVQRLIPSDFGSDLSIPANAAIFFNQPKIVIHDYLYEKAKEHPSFSYTFVSTGPFFDWCLRVGLTGDPKNHKMTLWDGGSTKMSTTTLASVGLAVAGVLRNPEATKNKELRVASTTISQNEIIALAKEIDGKEWTTTPGSTADAYAASLEELKKPEPNMTLAIYNQLYRMVFSIDHSPDFSDKLDNELLGVPVLTREQVKEVIKELL